MNYGYFGLNPQKFTAMHRINNTLTNYVPGSVNTMEVTSSFLEGGDLPFSGKIGASRQIDPVDTNYNDPNLLGVVGHSPEQVAYYQRGLPQYITEHYNNIPLYTPQSQYMSDKGIAYTDLYNPADPVRLPLT